ncbi:helix-turn-helix domain-containing protein [Entomomonas moraniae]|uniref:Helix-turn-helix domain-containing protein n=1 Tax=Entomomonas moraniae TaxID=2213226 RepID=A0A3S9XD32_9GAMM|nr:RodZ domain-containing protein [Entomomonas moraniae]AZS50333.1 helix-turn-helix domain-containing protein [Entomomonas moraniae]
MSTDPNKTNEVSQPCQLLKAEREKRGITTKQIADVLNLPERFIIFLEAGEFSKLPGATFTRGYIRNYAKYLELTNIDELVGTFDACVGNDATDTRVLDFKQIKRIKSISNSIYWLVSFVVCLILAGIVFLIWQHFVNSNTNQTIPSENGAIIVEPGSTASTVLQEQNTIPVISTDSSTLPLALNNTTQLATDNALSPVNTDKDAVSETNIQDQSEQNDANAQENAKPSLKKGEGLIEANFKANCWVSITDATGKVLVSKLFTANTHLNISGKAPLDVVLGAPSAVSMSYNGEPVQLNQTSNSTHRIKLGK